VQARLGIAACASEVGFIGSCRSRFGGGACLTDRGLTRGLGFELRVVKRLTRLLALGTDTFELAVQTRFDFIPHARDFLVETTGGRGFGCRSCIACGRFALLLGFDKLLLLSAALVFGFTSCAFELRLQVRIGFTADSPELLFECTGRCRIRRGASLQGGCITCRVHTTLRVLANAPGLFCLVLDPSRLNGEPGLGLHADASDFLVERGGTRLLGNTSCLFDRSAALSLRLLQLRGQALLGFCPNACEFGGQCLIGLRAQFGELGR
jgi:hypothetical protein